MAAGHQDRRTERRQQQQNVELLAVDGLNFEVAKREKRHREGSRDHKSDIEKSVPIENQQRGDLARRQRRDDPQGNKRSGQSDQGQHEGKPMVAADRNSDHDGHRRSGE